MLISKDHRIFIIAEFSNRFDFTHILIMLSFQLESFKHLCFCFTFKNDSLSNKWSSICLSLGDCCSLVSICIRNYLCSIGLGSLNNLSFDESRLSDDLVVLEISLSVYLINHSVSTSRPLTLCPGNLGFHLLDFLLFLELLKLILLDLVFPLIIFDLLESRFLLSIVRDPLVVSKSFSF